MMSLATWLAAPLLLAAASGGGSDCTNEALARASEQIRLGAFDESLLSLDQAIRELKAEEPSTMACSRSLAQAYVRRGVAYLGVGQEDLARASFVQALALDGSLTLAPGEWSRKVLRAWEAARKAHAEKRAQQRSVKHKGYTSGLLIAGVGLGAGALSAAAVKPVERDRENQLPVAAIIDRQPAGTPIANLTRVTFFGSGSDPDGESLSFSWSFGWCGGSASGAAVSVVFTGVGECNVQLTVTDGAGATAAADTTVTVGTLAATWRATAPTICDLRQMQITNVDRSSLAVTAEGENTAGLRSYIWGYVLPPRSLYLEHELINDAGNYVACNEILRLEATTDLDTINGTTECTWGDYRTPYRARNGQQRDVTFRRQ